MTLLVDDGTENGYLANCGNCPYTLNVSAFRPSVMLDSDWVCTWDPPQPVVWTGGRLDTGHNGVSWLQPAVEPEEHCHNHPVVNWHTGMGPFAVRRAPEVAEGGGE